MAGEGGSIVRLSRVRGCGQCLFNQLQHTFKILEHIIVPETDHTESLFFEKRRSCGISFTRMLPSVHFHDYPCRRAQEINDIASDLDLSPKFRPREIPVTQLLP